MTRLAFLAAAVLLLSCKTLSGMFSDSPDAAGAPGAPGAPDDAAKPDFASDAEANLKKGQEALEGGDFTNAQRYFEYVATKYPFLDAAKIADLRLADTQLGAEQYAEGRERFQTFVRMHPTHPEVDYAAMKAAESYYLEAPKPFFVFPPVYEKDLTGVRNAVRALEDFMRDYPDSKHKAEAQKTLDDARRRLAQHELYVADFYAKRKQWPAVVGRLKTLVNDYAHLGFDEEALFKLHDAYVKLNDPQGAKDALKQIITRMPNTPAAQKATRLLGS